MGGRKEDDHSPPEEPDALPVTEEILALLSAPFPPHELIKMKDLDIDGLPDEELRALCSETTIDSLIKTTAAYVIEVAKSKIIQNTNPKTAGAVITSGMFMDALGINQIDTARQNSESVTIACNTAQGELNVSARHTPTTANNFIHVSYGHGPTGTTMRFIATDNDDTRTKRPNLFGFFAEGDAALRYGSFHGFLFEAFNYHSPQLPRYREQARTFLRGQSWAAGTMLALSNTYALRKMEVPLLKTKK